MRRSTRSSRGFTLIELLFAMSFVSVLLILILTATLQITRIYNKGITLKQVDQAGASIGSEFQSALKAGNAPYNTDSVLNGAGTGGRLCLGGYSYVWNLKGSTANRYVGSDDPIGLVKVADPTRAMCAGTPGVPKADATELLLNGQSGGVELRLRSLGIAKTAVSGTDYLYTVSYIISTDDDSLIEASSDGTEACKGGASDEYCALNSFGFDVYARQGGSGAI